MDENSRSRAAGLAWHYEEGFPAAPGLPNSSQSTANSASRDATDSRPDVIRVGRDCRSAQQSMLSQVNLKGGSLMRCIMALGACFSAALATAACNLITTDQRYVREGAGTDVYWSGLSDATYLQELYVGYICQQGGLSVTVQGDGPRCNDVTFGPREWGVFVQAGMNDIDKRCNAYL